MRSSHRTASPTQLNRRNQNVTHVATPMNQKTAGTEPTRQATLENEDTRAATSRSQLSKSSQKTKIAAPTLWGNGRHEGIYDRRPSNRYKEDFMTECMEEPTQDWRRWNLGMILRHNTRHPNDPTRPPYG